MAKSIFGIRGFLENWPAVDCIGNVGPVERADAVFCFLCLI